MSAIVTDVKAKTFTILIAAQDSHVIKDELSRKYHVFAVASAAGIVEACAKLQPELVIVDTDLGIERLVAPAILLMTNDPLAIDRYDNVVAMVKKPAQDLELAVRVALKNLERIRAAEKEIDSLRETLQERKLIEQAKGLVMKHLGVDEPEAYRKMRKSASHQNRKMCDLANQIIAAGEVFRALSDV